MAITGSCHPRPILGESRCNPFLNPVGGPVKQRWRTLCVGRFVSLGVEPDGPLPTRNRSLPSVKEFPKEEK